MIQGIVGSVRALNRGGSARSSTRTTRESRMHALPCRTSQVTTTLHHRQNMLQLSAFQMSPVARVLSRDEDDGTIGA